MAPLPEFPESTSPYHAEQLYRCYWDLVGWFERPARQRKFSRFELADCLVGYRELLKGLSTVPRKGKLPDTAPYTLAGRSEPQRASWLNVNLSDSDKLQAKTLGSDAMKTAGAFLSLVGDGNDISLKRTERGEYMACLFGSDAGGRRRALSAYAKDPVVAAAGLVVKWAVILDATWPTGPVAEDDDDIR